MKNLIRIRDNRGVTLLEVIIAVSIFTIVALVLLNGFYVTNKTNNKSASYQSATALAQSLMEGVKTNELSELARQFNFPWDVQKDTNRFSLLTMTDALSEGIRAGYQGGSGDEAVLIREVNGKGKQPAGYSSVSSANNGMTCEFKGQTSGQYFFQLHNVPMKNKRFDATVTLDGVNSVTDDDGGGSDKAYKDSNSKSSKPNNYENPVLENMDIYQDAFLVAGEYTQEGSIDRMGLTDLMEKKADYETLNPSPTPKVFTMEELAEDMERNIVISVKTTGGTTRVSVKYTVYSPKLNQASCPGNGGTHNGSGECFCTYINENSFYDNSETTLPLKNVYLIYCPNYSSKTSGTGAKDKITFNNPDNKALNFYLIKQKMSSLSTEELKSAEIFYKMNLTIEETPKANWNTLASRYRGATKLRTNLNSNIAYDTQAERDSNQNAKNQVYLTYRAVNTGRSVNSDSGNNAPVFNITQMKNLQSSEQKYRLFSIHVAIYQPGTLASGDPASWKDKLIVALDSSKEN